MDVVGKAVIGGAQGDDCFQRLGLACRDLQAVKAAPGNPHHADIAVAPGLPAQPVDHFEGVVLFLQQVLVGHQPLTVAIATHVDPDAGIAMPRHIGMHPLIPRQGAIALAIGQVFEDRRVTPGAGIGRQPDTRGQLGAVLQGDQAVLDFAHGVSKFSDDFHQ